VAGLSYNQTIDESSEVGGGRQTIFQRCRRGEVDGRGRWERLIEEVDRRSRWEKSMGDGFRSVTTYVI
jgi:hypothetical protein